MARERIINTYEIGDFVITEKIIPSFGDDPQFAVGAKNGLITVNRLYPTLETAIVGALALRYDGSNTQADRLICQMLGIGEPDFWR